MAPRFHEPAPRLKPLAAGVLLAVAPWSAHAQDAGTVTLFGGGNGKPLPKCSELRKRPPPHNTGLCAGPAEPVPPGHKAFGMIGLTGSSPPVDLFGSEPAAPAPSLDRQALKDEVRARVPQIVACYRTALKTQPTLQGTVSVRFTIGTDGAVSGASAGDALGAPSLGACIEKAVSSWTLALHPGAPATITYPFTLKPD
ncbi:MAG: AgmX/PglI C-terminal domain-containing protein [Myxococcaceae bacterium]|nr:AgmX/PglI C-terminal domain-containing protein [Myxococcaceae bacterium]